MQEVRKQGKREAPSQAHPHALPLPLRWNIVGSRLDFWGIGTEPIKNPMGQKAAGPTIMNRTGRGKAWGGIREGALRLPS